MIKHGRHSYNELELELASVDFAQYLICVLFLSLPPSSGVAGLTSRYAVLN